MKKDRIDNDVLLHAGLDLMQRNGKPLTKLPSKGRSMLYRTPDSETVRARTCNDHILIAVADKPTEDARLNIEGTDCLLVVMPKEERTYGEVIAYLIPTPVAVEAARRTHQEWLSTNPNTKGQNNTFNLWFDDNGPEVACGFGRKWAQYLLKGSVTVQPDGAFDGVPQTQTEGQGNIKAEVEAAKQRIARVAGVAPEAIKISIEFGI